MDGVGRYEARIACNLWSKDGVARYDKRFDKKAHPFFTQTGKDREQDGDQYIANMRDGSVAGFKYFSLGAAARISLELGGNGEGKITVATSPDFTDCDVLPVKLEGGFKTFEGSFHLTGERSALYFRYTGTGAISFHAFELLRE